jgi:hypothetical protein
VAPSGLPCPASQQVSPVDESVWLERMRPTHDRWAARAAEPGLTPTVRAYATGRARRTAAPYMERLEGCARAGVTVACGCRTDVRWFTCRAHLLCPLCRKQRVRVLRAKIFAALDGAMSAAPRGYQLVMVTIGMPHADDVGAVRKELMASWRRYYKANHRRWGGFFYVGTHEITVGTDGLGHPHAHVVCLWPRGGPGDGTQGDWELQCKLWREAAPTSTRISFRASKNAAKAATYLSKYVSKGVQTSDFTPELRAKVLAGTYNTRWLFTSRKAWVFFEPFCRACGCKTERVRVGWHGRCAGNVPDGTPDWWLERGPPQQSWC